jgi:hypothetical protein
MRDDELKQLIASIRHGCDRALRDEAERTLGPVAASLDGGPFALRQGLAAITRCVEVHDRTDAEAVAWLVSRTRQSPPAVPPH